MVARSEDLVGAWVYLKGVLVRGLERVRNNCRNGLFQKEPFANIRLSSLLCGFRDGYSTQHALFRLIEACRSTLDKKGYVGMVLMDLSKAYD